MERGDGRVALGDSEWEGIGEEGGGRMEGEIERGRDGGEKK